MNDKKDGRFFFLKFGAEEHLRQLVEEGCIYCNPFTYFKEGNNKGGGRFDPDEFIDHYHQPGDVTKLTLDGIKVDLAGPLKITMGSISYTHLFSLTAVRLETLEGGGRIYDERSWDDFGGYVALIHDPRKFLNKLEETLAQHSLQYALGAVEYVDPATYSGEVGPFRKFNHSSWQQEVRIAVFDGDAFDARKPLTVSLGSIADIAHGPVHRSKCFNRVDGDGVLI